MEPSIFASPLKLVSLFTAAVAAILVAWYLIRRPRLHASTKLVLLAGLGLFPIMSAASGNMVGYEATTRRQFCNSCHVMEPWIDDVENPASTSLAASHSRNELFGDKSCYTCHADYGMFGAVQTKLTGLKHVMHYLADYRNVPVEVAIERIELFEPYPNSNCTHCHSMKANGWAKVPDHAAMKDPDQVSCASAGCHGPAHPFAGGSR
jgi:cytochrome c-type protein NapC